MEPGESGERGASSHAATRRSPSSDASVDLRIGRYEILEVIGSGSTGTVYRAHDRELDRHVSLKLLHAAPADVSLQAEARGRLLREAQVLARLSHQNVVAAYDVGTHEGALFISMEFIEGASLRDWLRQPRRQDEVLRVLIAAGRGLASAHAGGVLHRDFKPANVMVSSDGRVRVVDFGLARAASVVAPETAQQGGTTPLLEGARPHSRGAASSHTLTRTDGVVGTPGFIAPEQWLGETVDPRSDQFSYAVTAFVALTGQMPYPDGVEPKGAPSRSRARTPWPRSVPRALRRIVDRGLSPRPEQRYPSVTAMVNALERFASPERWHASRLVIGAALVTSMALPGALRTPMDGALRCNVDDAALIGVWDPNQREQMERAFLATGKKHAAEAFALVSQRLDLFRSQWLAMRRASCEATLVRGEQAERVMLLRASCLDRALEGTKALVGALVKADAGSIDRITEASPPSVTACTDVAALLGFADQLPADPSLRASIDEVERGLAVNQALVEAGEPEAVEQAQRILELARATQHLPAQARASAQLGRATLEAATKSEQRKLGVTILNESLRLAALAGDAQLAAHTATFLFYTIANAEKRVQEGEAMLPVVDALVRQAGNPPLPRIQLLHGQSEGLVRHNEVEAAAGVLEEAIRIAEENVGPEFQRLANAAAGELGHVYAFMGRFADSESIAQRGVDGMRRLFGSHHPRLLVPLANLAVLRAKAGHLEAALEAVAEYRALAGSLPPDEPRLKWVPLMESRVWRTTGHCDRAVPLLRESLAKFSALHGPEHALTIRVTGELGICLAETQHVAEGIALLERALANRRDSQDAAVADVALDLARALWQLPEQRARARALADEARSLWLAEKSSIRLVEVDEWLATHPL